MASQVAKIAVSLPKQVARDLELFRKELGIGRSAVILEAVRLWMKQRRTRALEARHVRGYQKNPETGSGPKALYRLGLQSFSKENW